MIRKRRGKECRAESSTVLKKAPGSFRKDLKKRGKQKSGGRDTPEDPAGGVESPGAEGKKRIKGESKAKKTLKMEVKGRKKGSHHELDPKSPWGKKIGSYCLSEMG